MTITDETAESPATLDLSGRTALVTGAASGIGRACAERLAAAKARVVAVDIDGPGAAATARRVNGEAVTLDLSDLAAVDAALARVGGIGGVGGVGGVGGIDILVNNAGIQHVAPIQDFPPEMFHRILTVMQEAPFRLIRACLPHMYRQGWGRIVNVSSVHGLRASEYKSAYVSAKHGLEGLSKVTALEGAPHGVTSNCVNPGYVRTPLVEKQVAGQAAAHGIDEAAVLATVFMERTAIKRLIEPAEVAEAVAFLCSPAAATVTGTSFTMDGGWTAR